MVLPTTLEGSNRGPPEQPDQLVESLQGSCFFPLFREFLRKPPLSHPRLFIFNRSAVTHQRYESNNYFIAF